MFFLCQLVYDLIPCFRIIKWKRKMHLRLASWFNWKILRLILSSVLKKFFISDLGIYQRHIPLKSSWAALMLARLQACWIENLKMTASDYCSCFPSLTFFLCCLFHHSFQFLSAIPKEKINIRPLLVFEANPFCLLAFSRFEGQISAKNIEIGIIGADKKFRFISLFPKIYLCSQFQYLFIWTLYHLVSFIDQIELKIMLWVIQSE